MPATKPKANVRFNLSERRKKRAEALGGRHVEVEDDSGKIILVPRMAFWSAETYNAWMANESTFDLDALKLVMPEDEYAELLALSLELGDVRELMTEVMREAKDDPNSKGSSTR